MTWKLKRNVQWHDGKPFTADDIVFTWEYAADPADRGHLRRDLQGHRPDRQAGQPHGQDHLQGGRPRSWFEPFCGTHGQVLPKHVFEPFRGAKSREAPANLKPVGTGPYRIVDFKPGDTVRAELNPTYHVPNRPFFDTLEMKGGGDAASAARAVIQTGEYDYAWNMQVEDDILLRLEQGGRGKVEIVYGRQHRAHRRQLLGSLAPRWTGSGRARSRSTRFFTDPAVRQALNLLVDRSAVQEQIYGRQGRTSANYLNAPSKFRSGEHEVGVQRRQGQRAARAGGLEAGRRRHPRQGRQAPQDRVPDVHQRRPARRRRPS